MTKISNYKFQLRWTLLVWWSTVAISNDLELDAPVVFTDEACVITNRDKTIIERVRASATGGVLTLLKRGMEQDSETEDSNLEKEWREGATCYMTILWPQLVDLIADNTFTGNIAFSKSLREPVYADATARDAWIPSPLNGMRIYNTALWLFQKYQAGSWEDDTSGGATPNASTTVAGKVEQATPAQVVAGNATGETGAPLFATPEDLSAQIQSWSYLYWVDAWGDDAYVVALTPVLASYTAGQLLWFKVTTTNTGACTVDFWPGVLNIKTKDWNDPQSGVIRTNGTNFGYYDWTNFVLLQEDFATTSNRGIAEMATDAEALARADEQRYINSKQLGVNSRTTAGNTQRTTSASTWSENIAHWLWQTPRLVELYYAERDSSATASNFICMWTYDWTTNQTLGLVDIWATAEIRLDTTKILVHQDSTGAWRTATATFDATNIVLSWTKTGAGQNIDVIWKAHA